MDPDQAAACPRLVRLRTWTSVKVLQKLPAETMTSLHIDIELGSRSHEEIERLVAALSRLTRLKRLIIVQGLRFYPAHLWTDMHDRSLCKLFTDMKELEVLDITLPERTVVDVDVPIATLVHNCPSVRMITMHNARMTNASLQSLSRLTGTAASDH